MSKIDQQIEELKARKKNVTELKNLSDSIGKMLSDKEIQTTITDYISKLSSKIEEGLSLEDLNSNIKEAKLQFTEDETLTLKRLAQKALAREIKVAINHPPEASKGIDLSALMSQNKVDKAELLKNRPTTSGLGNLDPITFHQKMATKIGKIVTNLEGKPIGILHNQSFPELIIKTPNGNTMEIHSNKVFIED